MTVLPITCDNCGAKYKLPETFTGSQAKCQKCGSVIDVHKQRGQPAAASPAGNAAAAQKPAAAARPAVDRSKESPKAAERPSRAARGGAAKAADGDGKDSAPGRGRRERGEKKKDNNPMIFGGIGLLAIVVVAVVLLTRGGDEPKQDEVAKTPTPAAPAAVTADKPADKPADQPAPSAPADKPADKPAAKPADKPAADAGKTGDAPAAPTDAEAGKNLKPWEKLKIATADQLSDPKTYKEVVWPESIDAAKKARIKELCDDVQNGGRAGISAKPELVKLDYEALFGIVEKLRQLDYKTAEDSMVAFEFHKVLTQITGGLEAGFVPVEAGEEIDLRKAEWNTRTVKTWLQLFDKDEAAWKAARAERIKKAAASDK